jgi:hypothetical protein
LGRASGRCVSGGSGNGAHDLGDVPGVHAAEVKMQAAGQFTAGGGG